MGLAVVLLAVAAATIVPFASRGVRSVRVATGPSRGLSMSFDRRQSAALFVGVREFGSRSVEEVPFAVDDAVDLAYVFALEPRVALVPPRRVVLALSGRPVKPESRERLRALRDAGADVRAADAGSILTSLREQAALAGRDGLLVVSIATHGFVRDGGGYILAASSVLRDPATLLSTATIFDGIASSAAQRSLVFVDACRERMVSGTRAVLADAMSAAPLARRLSHTRGQVVFYAAAPGEWAYDDPDARNGVFTRAVIAGINCGAAKVRGAVTAETLAGYVERNVHGWIRDNRNPNVGSATQVTMDGEARNMPLAQCRAAAPSFGPARVTAGGTTVRALSDSGAIVWQRDFGSAVTSAQALDLDGDGTREVVLGTRDAVIVLDANGTLLWSARERMHLTAVATGDLLRRQTHEVLALWNGPHAARLVMYAPDGKPLGVYDADGHLDRIMIGRPTSRYVPRIVATSGNVVVVFDAKKLAAGKPLWAGRVAGTIAAIDIADCDGDGKDDIAITTVAGASVCIDFSGHPVGAHSTARFERLAPSRALPAG